MPSAPRLRWLARATVVLPALVVLLVAPATPRRTDAAFDALSLLGRGEASSTRPVGVGMTPAFGSRRFAIRALAPNHIDFPVIVPAHGVLRAGFTVLPTFLNANVMDKVQPVRFTIELRPLEGPPVRLVERSVDIRTRPPDRRWHDFRIDVSAYAGLQGTLRLDASTDATHTAVAWTRPIVYDRVAEAAQPNLLLITIDALRADHLSCYGYPRPTTPRIDALAAQGIRYANAFANAPMTVPSLPQLLTSRYFPQRSDPTLATQLFMAGMSATKAIVNNVYLNLWLTFRSRTTFDSLSAARMRAEHITRGAIRWLDAAQPERFALYLHYLDNHTPYKVPKAYAGQFIDPSYRGEIDLVFRDAEGARAGRYVGADRTRIVDLYDGTLRYVDDAIGKLLDELEARSVLDDTLVILTADHGEEFWDHDTFFHGQSLYDEQLHVPLIIRLPGAKAGGSTVQHTVRLVDILPTIIDVLGLPPLAGVAGTSLLGPDLLPSVSEDREVFARAANPASPYRFALRHQGHKLVATVETGEEELYDLVRDPGERTNIAARPEAAAVLGALRARLDAYRRTGWERDFQIRAVATDGELHAIDLAVEVAGGIPLTDIDRIGLDGSNRLEFTNGGRLLRWIGTVTGTPSGIRFSRDLLRAAGPGQHLTFRITVDGNPLPPEAIRLGGGQTAPSSPFEYAAGTPKLEADDPPSLNGGAGPVLVSIWRASDSAPAEPEGGVLTPEDRQRLRALGYVE